MIQKVDVKQHSVSYYSRKTSLAETKYHSYDLETQSIVNATKHFSPGHKFTVVTDCNSVKASKNKADLSPRELKWCFYLQSCDFDIVHREGSRMKHIDFLSKNSLPTETSRFHRRVGQNRVETDTY